MATPAEDDDYDPFEHRDVQHATTAWETFIHLLKGSLGTGILAMPMAFHHSGYVVGLVATFIIGAICAYCMLLVISCEYELCKRQKVPLMSYNVIAASALSEGPPVMRWFSSKVDLIVNIFLVTYQLGICVVYVIFIPANIKSVVDHYMYERWSIQIHMTLWLLPLIITNLVTKLKFLVPFSYVGIAMTIVAFGIILYYICLEGITLEGRQIYGAYYDFPLFFGTVLFSLEAVGVVIPLANEMENPKLFGRWFGLYSLSMLIIVVMYAGTGILGYLAYGDSVQGTISLNLRKGEIAGQVAQIMLALSIFISYPLQMYVAVDIIWNHYMKPKLEKRIQSKWRLALIQYTTRVILVLITYAMGMAIPSVYLFISLFGSLCLAFLGLALPAFIDLSTYWYKWKGMGKFFALLHLFAIVLLSILALVTGISRSIAKIVEAFESDKEISH